MLIENAHTIKGCPDFELNRARTNPLHYEICLPEKPQGLVIYIAGFGNDMGEYLTKYRQFIAKEYQLACMTVDYHACFSRPQNGATVVADSTTTSSLLNNFRETGYMFPKGASFEEGLEFLVQISEQLKTPLQQKMILKPKGDEYQNFGVMAAVDCLLAMQHALEHYHLPTQHIIAVGSSYGGYIANLMAKFASSTLTAVFDNSSWAEPNLTYVLGKEMGTAEVAMAYSQYIDFTCNTLSAWTSEKGMPNEFSLSRLAIRAFSAEHINEMAKHGGTCTQYYFIHSYKDTMAPTQDKRAYAERLRARGFRVSMQVVNENDVDGDYIKTTEHGLGLSMQTFFKRCYADYITQGVTREKTDFELDRCITFDTPEYKYHFVYQNGNLKAQCVINE